MAYSEDKTFKNIIIKYFEGTPKTGWGKNEIVRQIKELWMYHLEEKIEKQNLANEVAEK